MRYHIIYTLIYIDGLFSSKEWGYKVVSETEYLLYYSMDKIMFTGTQDECNNIIETLNLG